jgi:hypothetical protein
MRKYEYKYTGNNGYNTQNYFAQTKHAASFFRFKRY